MFIKMVIYLNTKHELHSMLVAVSCRIQNKTNFYNSLLEIPPTNLKATITMDRAATEPATL